MADYWKSQARKYCDFCKCWIADNKPSIQFHENGKRHKENVTKRIKDIHRNSAKQLKQQKKFESDLDAMNKAAMAAYAKDVQNNMSDLTAHQIVQNKQSEEPKRDVAPYNPNYMPEADSDAHPRGKPKLYQPKYTAADVDPFDPFAQQKLAKIAARDLKHKKKEEAKAKSEEQAKSGKSKGKGKRQEAAGSAPPVRKVWYEAKSQGYSYYWNIETNQTMWEPPLEGFMSLEEQAEEAKEQMIQQQLLEELEQQEKIEKRDIIEEQRANAEREKLKEIRKQFYEKQKQEKGENSEGVETESEEEKIPYRRDYSVPEKPQPYGSWQVVKTVKPVNLQLPKVEKRELPTIVFDEEPPPVRREFKEKTITRVSTGDSDDESSSVSFKKRKIGNKNVRKKLEDD